MSIMQKLSAIAEQTTGLINENGSPIGSRIERIYSATEGEIGGSKKILVGTNNYLGLTFEKECIEAGHEAARQYGTGTTGSRMANGSYADHLALESDLADFYGVGHCIVFSTGYVANLGMICSLVGPENTIFLDEHCHASIYDGCKLSGASIIHFRHNNAADLDKRLRRLGDDSANALIITEGLYSMLGDKAALREIVEVKKKYDALLMLDEAHSLGVLGATGRGLAEDLGVEDDIDFITGTFSKSLAGLGGFCVSRHAELEAVRFSSRPYVFTASPSPATIGSVRAALRIMRARPELQKQLWDNATFLYQGLDAMGFELGPEIGPVIAVNAGEKENALFMWQALFDQGIYVNVVFPPATPNSSCLLRCSVSAAHSREQMQAVLDAFTQFEQTTPATAAQV
ncbi:aminotransferase class I/II-fold pyridoxal phosphate-dependent enzyme [Gammaproteobacteria bacterium]|jgi:8-amino-7-oxononanoate synthase|nr:aminotransferase class I/II-fold pyridoxal phosphate-dependent enzyme [Gammaproteobacteria bacterium]